MQVSENIDILEDEILERYPDVLEVLLRDHTTQKNIFWATANYKNLGNGYQYHDQILPGLITGDNGHVIMPRVKKSKEIQELRVRNMAEVFTPSWICNAQNNLIDDEWFGRSDVFNFETIPRGNKKSWRVNKQKIVFPDGKTWRDYVNENRLEITCGEAPYLTSRYDTTTGEYIPVERRIGLLDRKLRVINENADDSGDWLKATQRAYQSIYGYEWQGDNLLLAREALLYTFIENYQFKFDKEPQKKSIKYMAYIISWNIWQMDGMKGVVPDSCGPTIKKNITLFGEEIIESSFCRGCLENDLNAHTGARCLIKDWKRKDPKKGDWGKRLRFIDLMEEK